jgi:hypothetical protein
MILNSKKKTINLQLRRFLFLFLLTVVIVFIYNLDFFSAPILVMDRTRLTIGFVALFLIYYLTGFFRNYHYFFYTDNGSKLVFRYYSLRPLNKKQSSVEIDKLSFSNYKIEKFLFGFTTRLFLFQNLPNGVVAKYAPINITLLNKKEKTLLNDSLKQYIKK